MPKAVPAGELEAVRAGLRRLAYARKEELLLVFDGLTLLAFDARTAAAGWQVSFERPIATVVAGPKEGEATVVDEVGAAHAIDLKDGSILRTADGVGPPHAVAAADVLVIAVSGALFIDGEQIDPKARTATMAFARDKKTLAIATGKGTLVLFDTEAKDIIKKYPLGLDITDIAPGREDEWVVAAQDGLYKVTGGKASKVMDRAVKRLDVEPDGKRVILQRSETKVAVYGWPPMEPQMRMLLDDPRSIEGVVITSENRLAFALDGGEVGIVSLGTKRIIHTETPHEGAEKRAWSMQVQRGQSQSEKERGGAQEAPKKSNAWKWGLGTAALAVFTFIRVFNHEASSGIKTPKDTTPPAPASHPHPAKPPPKTPTYEVVKLVGTALTAAKESHKIATKGLQKVWVAPNATIFLAYQADDAGTCIVQVKPPLGEWRTDLTQPCDFIGLFGRNDHDVYVSLDGDVFAYDGTKEWKQSAKFDSSIISFAGSTLGDDLYALTDDGKIQHRHAGKWAEEPGAGEGNPDLDELFSGKVLWAQADYALLRRTGTTWVSHSGGTNINDVWIGTESELFVARTQGIGQSTDEGATWKETPIDNADFQLIWGRSNTDVYAGGEKGLWHFDGHEWSKTTFDRPVEGIAGDANDVIVIAERPTN
jgi:hypothetical protein